MKKIILRTLLILFIVILYYAYDFYNFSVKQMHYYFEEYSYSEDWSDDESIEIVSCILINDYIEKKSWPDSWREECEFETMKSFICSKWISSLRLKVLSAQVQGLKIEVDKLNNTSNSNDAYYLESKLETISAELKQAEEKCANN